MNPAQDHGKWVPTTLCPNMKQLLLVQHVQDDTFSISDDGGVYLSDGATLTLLLKQLSGREDP